MGATANALILLAASFFHSSPGLTGRRHIPGYGQREVGIALGQLDRIIHQFGMRR